MKLKLKTEGLDGEDLAFVVRLNEKFAEMPDQLTSDDVLAKVKEVTKGMWDDKGDLAIDFAKLSDLHEKSFGEGEGSLKSILKRQGEVINSLKELGLPGQARVKSIREELSDFMTKNKEKVAAFIAGETKTLGSRVNKEGQNEAGLELKAAATITSTQAGTVFTPGVEVVPGLVPLARNKPFIEDYANTSATNRARIVWTEKYNPQGQAAFIAEGAVKPLISFTWREFESYAKKIADKIKVSTEALEDIDWMAAEIETELKYQVDITVDAALLTGNGDGSSGATNLQGLATLIGGYVLTSINTTTPNNYDALRAAYAQIVSLNFMANRVFINPIDGANMDLVKDANGRPLAMEYKDAQGQIMRIQPVETNQIPVGYFLMADMTRFKIRNYKPFAIYYGWVNDDFEKNLVTVIGERRLHSYVARNDFGAFVYDSFANVKTAITAA